MYSLWQELQAPTGLEEACQGKHKEFPSFGRARVLTLNQTHADDSVLVRSPDQHGGQVGGYRQQNGRGMSPPAYDFKHTAFTDLQEFTGGPTGYYDQSAPQMHQQSGAYGQPHHNPSHNGYYQPQQPQAYSMGYYPVQHHTANVGHHAAAGDYDQRKRGFDVLNDFFGDAKRRQIDPTSYPQVGQRLMSLHGLPISSGSLVDYMPSQPMMGMNGHGGPQVASMAQPHYSLPMPNLKTKTDLLNIDNFLDQMQATVYESSNQSAAAGVHQPGAHYTHQGVNFRQSHSPPQAASQNIAMAIGQQAPASTHTAPMMAQAHSPQSSTPALTPTSGNVSYTSGHSPSSAPGLSPSDSSRHGSTTSAGYPTLPAVSSVYAPHSTTSPVSTLGTNFDSDPRRRYSGGMLQKAAGGSRFGAPAYTSNPSPTQAAKQLPYPGQSSSNIDPALSGVSSPGAASDSEQSARDRAEEVWVENIRVIEALKRMVAERLERHEYDDDTAEHQRENSQETVKQEQSLYPVLRAAIDAED